MGYVDGEFQTPERSLSWRERSTVNAAPEEAGDQDEVAGEHGDPGKRVDSV